MKSKQEIKKQNMQQESKNKSKTALDNFEKSIENYFKNVSMNTASYLQTVSDLQQEIIESRKKNAESVIMLQKSLQEKTDSGIKLSDKSLNVFSNFTEQTNKAWNFQNQLMIKSLDALSRNIQAFNDNAEALTEMNKKLIESWALIIKKQKGIKK